MADNIKIEKRNTDYKSLKNKNVNNMTTEVMQNTDPGFSKKKQKKTSAIEVLISTFELPNSADNEFINLSHVFNVCGHCSFAAQLDLSIHS